MKRKIFLCAVALTLFSFSICFAVEFSDVSKEHWAYEYINKLSNDGVINGFEDGSFRPSETLTKAQFIKLMVSSDKLLVHYPIIVLIENGMKTILMLLRNTIFYLMDMRKMI